MALVLSEDQRFYEHSGVDWAAVTAAAWGNLWNSRTRGASTITMQLAGLLDGTGARARRAQRGAEAGPGRGRAGAGTRWRKDQILEAYLNLVPFRGEIVGIDALSRSLFGKAPHGLDLRKPPLPPPWCARPMPAPSAWPSVPAGYGATCSAAAATPENSQNPSRTGEHPRASAGRAGMAVSQILQQRRWPASEARRPTLRASGCSGAGQPQAAAHQPARRCAAGGAAKPAASAELPAAMWKTAPWCWTTPAARCWPGWALPAA
jgi:penicillin-binding protein 1C